VLELPWEVSTNDEIDIKKAEKILNEDHYGLEEVKERILEFLAIKKIKQYIKRFDYLPCRASRCG